MHDMRDMKAEGIKPALLSLEMFLSSLCLFRYWTTLPSRGKTSHGCQLRPDADQKPNVTIINGRPHIHAVTQNTHWDLPAPLSDPKMCHLHDNKQQYVSITQGHTVVLYCDRNQYWRPFIVQRWNDGRPDFSEADFQWNWGQTIPQCRSEGICQAKPICTGITRYTYHEILWGLVDLGVGSDP